MRNSLLFFCCLLAGWSSKAEAAPILQPNDMLAICGDSITAQHLYSSYIEDYLLMCQPTDGLGVAQFGWGGERAPGFLARLDTDVYPFKPTVATSCYGMNDGGYGPANPTIRDTYRTAQTAIIESFKAHGVRAIVLGSPKCVDSFTYRDGPKTAAVYNRTLSALAEIDREIATKENVVYADVFGETMKAMPKAKAEYGDKYPFGGVDGIHPGPPGHLVMAYAFLKALGYDGAIGTLTVDLDAGKADGSAGQKVISFQDGTLSVESTRYPFCFFGQPDSADQTTAGILKCVPFNDDLNRYLLVVKGLKTAHANVTWGGVTKEFAAADLAQGVNLAAEFLVNPFVDQFMKVDAAVSAEQSQEQLLVQEFMHNLRYFKIMVPDDTAALDKIVTDGMAQRQKLFQAAAALVVPVRHTIKIEPVP